MTGCSAIHCTHSYSKGFVLVRFPKDEALRAKWSAAVGRVDWNPTPSNRICEVHFERDQWEKYRCRLKKDAVPTLFCTCQKEPPRQKRSLSLSDSCVTGEQAYLWDHSYSSPPERNVHRNITKLNKSFHDHTYGASEPRLSPSQNLSPLSSTENLDHTYIRHHSRMNSSHCKTCFVPHKKVAGEVYTHEGNVSVGVSVPNVEKCIK